MPPSNRPRLIQLVHLVAICLCGLAWLVPAAAMAQAVGLEGQKDGLVGVDADGVQLWKIRHCFAGKDARHHLGADLRFDPVVDGRRAYYARDADLLTVDLDAGKIVQRRRFPTTIGAVELNGDQLSVDLIEADDPDEQTSGSITVSYIPGQPAPGRGPFGARTILTARQEADWLSHRIVGRDLHGVKVEEATANLKALAAQEKRDPTNIFLPLYRGRILEWMGKKSEAQQAFQKTVDTRGAPWSDDLYASAILDMTGHGDLAGQVIERGRQKMADTGVRAERMYALRVHALVFFALSDAMDTAITDKNYQRVDRLAGRMFETFPAVNWSQLAWTQLARWYADQDQTELAKKWRSRREKVAANALSSWMYRLSRTIDRVLLAMISGFFALMLIAFAIGLRSAGRRRTMRGIGVPEPRLLEVLGLVLLLVGGAMLMSHLKTRVIAGGTLMDAPAALKQDAVASPKVRPWLEELAPSQQRDQWIDYAKKEHAALLEGTRSKASPPSGQALVEAVEIDATTSDQATSTVPGGQILASAGKIFTVLSYATGALMAFICGLLLGNFLPRTARYIRWLIPGGARPATIFGPVICAVVMAAFLTLAFDLDQLFTQLLVPDFQKYFGLEDVSLRTMANGWAWPALGVGLLAHMTTVWWETRRDNV